MRTVNFDKSARYKRKVIVEDIGASSGDGNNVKIIDHDGSLRSATEAELRHRHQLKQRRRKKKN